MTLPIYKFFSNRNHLYITLILCLAFGLRIWGIQFGLPFSYHADEDLYILNALKMGKFGLNPHYFINPPLYSYILFILYIGYYMIGHLLGTFHSTTQFVTQFVNDPTTFYTLARLISAIFGVIAVYYVYKIGTLLFRPITGLLSAMFLSVAFLHVRQSHFAVTDITMTTLFIIGYFFFIEFIISSVPRKAIISALWIGLATSTKYTAILFFPIFLLTLFTLRPKFANVKALVNLIIASSAALVVGFLIGCPYALLDFKEFWTDFGSLFYYSQTGWFGVPLNQNGYLFYLDCLRWGLGWPLLVLSLFSVFYLFYKKRTLGFMLLSFPIAFYLYMGHSRLQMERFILPVIPFLAIASAITIIKISDSLSQSKIVIFVLATITTLVPLSNSMQFDYLLTKPDTRTEAKEWIEKNLPQGSKLAIDGYGPILHMAHPKLFDFLKSPPTESKFDVTYLGRFGLGLYSMDYYQYHNFNYLISSNYTYERYFTEKDLYPKETRFYINLENTTRLIQTFSPYKNNYHPPYRQVNITGPSEYLFQFKQPGPLIKIYALE